MEMVEKKQRDKKFRHKRKLFDDSEPDKSESSSEEEIIHENPIHGKKSNVVKRMIYNEPTQPKRKEKSEEKDPFPKEIEDILNQKKNELDFIIQNYKREFDICRKAENEYSQLLNDFNRSERLHAKDIEEMREGVDKRIESEKLKLKKEKRVAERQNKAMKNMPNRREREEIEILQKELKKLEENLKIKEQRNKLNIERMRKQINEQEKRNEELIEEKESVSQVLRKIIREEGHNEEEKENPMNEERKDQINQNPNIGHKMKKPKQINFYEPTHEKNKRTDIIEMIGTSHSPHFGSQKFEFEDK